MMADLPDALASAIAAETAGRRDDQLAADTEKLITRYRADIPATAGQPIMAGDEEAVAYAAYRMPATYAAIRAALEQIPDAAGSPQTHLDIAGGTGAGLWAVADRWPEVRQQRVLEQSSAAIALGRRLAAASASASLRDAIWEPAVLRRRPEFEPAQVITVGYLLSELDPAARAELIVAVASAVQRLLIIVEPGTKAGYRRIVQARDQLIDAGLQIVAPCPHQVRCPLRDQQRDWCHFATRIGRSSVHRRIKRAELGYEDEKFSYLVATPRALPTAANRVLRHPQFPKGRVLLQLCRQDGTAAQLTVAKRDLDYKQARRTGWGDAWPPPAANR